MGQGGSSLGGKLGKLLAGLVAVGGGGGAAVGYGMGDKDEIRHEIVIDAKIDKVWDLLSDPEKTPRWMPQDILDVVKVEKLKPPKEQPTPATHRFVLRDGRTIDIHASVEDDPKVFRETIVSRSEGESKYFTSFEWGFEIYKSSDDRNKTRIVLIKRAQAKRPLGVIAATYYRLTGKQKQNAQRIVQNIERVARE